MDIQTPEGWGIHTNGQKFSMVVPWYVKVIIVLFIILMFLALLIRKREFEKFLIPVYRKY